MTTKSRYINTITFSLLALTFLSGMALLSSDSSATDIVDEINITVPSSCSLSGTGMTSHTATIENGRYVSDIGTTTLKAFCNDNNGFAIYATGYTGNEIGQENSNKLVGTPSTIGNISTGTATSGDTSNWSMKLATTSTPTPTYPITIDNSFNAYKEVPNEYTKVAHRDSSTDIGENAEGATLTTTYASYISKTQAAGAYAGKVIYTLVHPSNEEPPHEIACEAGKICYNANTTTALGEMGKQATRDTYGYNTDGAIAAGSSATLWAPNFKRAGYGFAGWNTSYDYTGDNYGPNQTITAPADFSTSGLSLYAMWIPSQGILQNWNGCSSMSIGDVTALTDNRDNDTYAVAKLADGKCWTIENLRLDNVPELTASNTNNPSLPLVNSWFYEYHQTPLTTSNHLSSPVRPSSDPWCTDYYSASCTDQSMLATDNTVYFVENSSSNYNIGSDVYSYGNYYNWYSATAGHAVYSFTDGNTPGDICPIGWHLPSGNSGGDFEILDRSLSSIAVSYRNYPNNFILSGNSVARNEIRQRGASGCYHSATKSGNTSVYSMSVDSSYVNPGRRSGGGLVVRCMSNS